MIDYSICIKSAKPGTKKEQITHTKAYGQAQVRKNFTLDKFAKHIADHGCVYDAGDIHAVLVKAVNCLRELILEGNSVTLGNMGTFAPSLSTEGAVTTEDFTVDNIKKVNVTWRKSILFNGKYLRDEAQFQLVPSRKLAADAIEVIKNTDTIQGLE